MKKRTLTALAALLALGSAAALAQPSGDAARGKSVFMKDMCWTCHGTDGHGSPYGVRLAPQPIPSEAFAHQLRHPRGTMPPYGPAYVSDRDVADIYAYIASIKAGPKASDIPLLKD